MSFMNDKYFLDTNIIVYAHDSTTPTKQEIAQEYIFNGIREHTGVISAQVLSEFFVTVTKKIKQTLSIPVARHSIALLSTLQVVDIDFDIVLRAIRMQEEYHIGYWDGMIIAAAERARCKTLYTEDLNPGQTYAGIMCINPFHR